MTKHFENIILAFPFLVFAVLIAFSTKQLFSVVPKCNLAVFPGRVKNDFQREHLNHKIKLILLV